MHWFFSGGPVSRRNTCCGALLHLRRDVTDTPWLPLTATCMCLEALLTTLCPMSCTVTMWTLRPGRWSTPALTVRYEQKKLINKKNTFALDFYSFCTSIIMSAHCFFCNSRCLFILNKYLILADAKWETLPRCGCDSRCHVHLWGDCGQQCAQRRNVQIPGWCEWLQILCMKVHVFCNL